MAAEPRNHQRFSALTSRLHFLTGIVIVNNALDRTVDACRIMKIAKAVAEYKARHTIHFHYTMVMGIPLIFSFFHQSIPHLIQHWNRPDAALNAERGEKGTLLASGFIAGGALMGVASAAMRFGGINLVNDAWLQNTWSEVLALGAYAILIFYLIKASMKTK